MAKFQLILRPNRSIKNLKDIREAIDRALKDPKAKSNAGVVTDEEGRFIGEWILK